MSNENIFVHSSLPKKIRYTNKNINIIPCGVNLKSFYPCDVKDHNNGGFGIKYNSINILFSSRFDRTIKNYTLAKKGLNILNQNINLIELKGYKPSEVNFLMNSVDLLLVTSLSETGPLVAKEAMACNCPIVATNVGDIAWLFGDEPGHFITSFEPEDVARKIELALKFSKTAGRTNGRERILQLGLDSETIAQRIVDVYQRVLQRKQK